MPLSAVVVRLVFRVVSCHLSNKYLKDNFELNQNNWTVAGTKAVDMVLNPYRLLAYTSLSLNP